MRNCVGFLFTVALDVISVQGVCVGSFFFFLTNEILFFVFQACNALWGGLCPFSFQSICSVEDLYLPLPHNFSIFSQCGFDRLVLGERWSWIQHLFQNLRLVFWINAVITEVYSRINAKGKDRLLNLLITLLTAISSKGENKNPKQI